MQKKIVKTIVVIVVLMLGMMTSMEHKGKLYAENDIAEQKIICMATAEDDFAGDSILKMQVVFIESVKIRERKFTG